MRITTFHALLLSAAFLTGSGCASVDREARAKLHTLFSEGIAPVSSSDIADLTSRCNGWTRKKSADFLTRLARDDFHEHVALAAVESKDEHVHDTAIARLKQDHTGYILARLGGYLRRPDAALAGMQDVERHLAYDPITVQDLERLPVLVDIAMRQEGEDQDSLVRYARSLNSRFAAPIFRGESIVFYDPQLDVLAKEPHDTIKVDPVTRRIVVNRFDYNLENFFPACTPPDPLLAAAYDFEEARSKQLYEFLARGEISGDREATAYWARHAANTLLAHRWSSSVERRININLATVKSGAVRRWAQDWLVVDCEGTLYASYAKPGALETLDAFLVDDVPQNEKQFLGAIGVQDMQKLTPYQAIKITSCIGQKLLATGQTSGEADFIPIDELIDAANSFFRDPYTGCCRHISPVYTLILESLKRNQTGDGLRYVYTGFMKSPYHVYTYIDVLNARGVNRVYLDGNEVIMHMSAERIQVPRVTTTHDDTTTRAKVDPEFALEQSAPLER